MSSFQLFLVAVGLLLLLLFSPVYIYYVIKFGTLGYFGAKRVLARLERKDNGQGEKNES